MGGGSAATGTAEAGISARRPPPSVYHTRSSTPVPRLRQTRTPTPPPYRTTIRPRCRACAYVISSSSRHSRAPRSVFTRQSVVRSLAVRHDMLSSLHQAQPTEGTSSSTIVVDHHHQQQHTTTTTLPPAAVVKCLLLFSSTLAVSRSVCDRAC